MQPFYASQVYGGAPAPQPTPTGIADHVGRPEPLARTVATPGGVLANPVLALVALVAVAVLLVNFTVRVEVSG